MSAEIVVRSSEIAPECGRRVCAHCVPMRDMGPAPGLPAGAVTHGICAACLERDFGDVLRSPGASAWAAGAELARVPAGGSACAGAV